MLVETKKRLKELQTLFKKEPQPISSERANAIFKKVFPNIADSAKGLSRKKADYPQFFKGIKFTLGTELSDGNIMREYLKKRAKNITTAIETSTPKLNKAAKTNLEVSTLAAIVRKFNKENGEKFLLRGGAQFQDSKHDETYKNSKKFKTFYDNAYKTPWNEADTYQKSNAAKSFKERGKIPTGYTLTTDEFLKKISGISKGSIASLISNPNQSNTGKFIKENFDFKIAPTPAGSYSEGKGTKQRYWKDPSDTTVRKWKRYLNSKTITSDMRNRVETLYNNDDIKDLIFKQKKLPSLPIVQTVLNDTSPSKAANAMATLARVLKGDEYKGDIKIPKDVVTGKRILNQIGDIGKRDPYRVAFYNAALSNVDQFYKNEGNASLSSFKTAFRDQLKNILDIPEKGKVPFSVNEVIGISTGEMRGLQPYSAFVDVTEKGINEGPLAQYQGRLSRSIGRVQTALAAGDTAGAQKIADELIANVPTYKGFKDLSKAQIESLSLPEIKIGKEIDPNVFSKEQLARYKTKGLDIQAITDREGFYIDPKGRKPFFDVSEQSFKNTLLKAARTNEGNVCQIFRAEGGRIGFAAGSSCVKQMEFAFDSDPVKLSQDINKLPYEEGPINKVKSVATKFLQSPMLRGAGKYGAIAAGGAVAAGFVKEFMNDDPTTYLSNEEQQKNLLIDMVTGSLDDTPEQSPAIGDAYLPALGATTVAGTAAVAPSTIEAARSGALGAKKSGITKTALKTLGRGLSATQTPLGLLATEPLYLAEQVQQGDSLTDIATNPFNYMGAAFAGPATEFATKGLNPTIAKTMRLGISPTTLKTVSRRFGLPGLALSMGISGYEMFDDYRNKRGMFSEE